MRLFTGLDVPYEMRRNLELLLQLLKQKASIAWSPLDNLHITTMFIGEVPEQHLDDIKAALERVSRPGDLKLAIRGLGWFPNPHNPRVFFAGIAAPPELHSLAVDTRAAITATGVLDETQLRSSSKDIYSPHLTLARIRDSQPLFDLKKAIADLPSVDFGAFTASKFHLYKSDTRHGGSVYTKLASYSLSA